MQVSILGPVEVVRDGESITVGGARVRALLARLAAAAGQVVSPAELVATIWPEESPTDEVNALQSLVSRLRRALGDPGAVVAGPGGYRLAIEAEAVDAHRFEDLARRGRAALRAGRPAEASATLTDALALWRSAALTDLGDAAGSRLAELRLGALEDRIDADIRRGRSGDVTAELEALAVAYPMRERLSALLMDALHSDGRPAEALAAYERTRRNLAETLGIDPSPSLAARHLAVLRGEPISTAGPAAPPALRRTNLRAPITSFLGRAEEMARVLALLGQSRLVTLVGPGGAGKTRLACEVGARLPDSTPDGVWLVELAAVTDPVDLAQSVIGSLGVREAALFDTRSASRRDAVAQLLDALAGKRAVLIMDNCEHLLDAAAQLTDDLLAHCPELRILATSREPLGITGEALFGVPPLRSRANETTLSPAVELFLDRARAVRPGLEPGDVSPVELDMIAEICGRLDGLPLAIELAAARTRSLTIEQVADRLGDRFRLLTGGSRTALPRHRTLRAVVEWSWELLSAADRELIEGLAVFAGGITAASAAAVAGTDPDDTLDRLAALVDKSLLQVADGPTPRYRMLETIREYGLDRLLARGALPAARTAHADYFRELARTAEPQLRTAGQMPWLQLLNAERENVFAALAHLADVGAADAAVDLAAAMGWFWTMRGEHAVAQTWIGVALDVPGGSPSVARVMAETLRNTNAGVWAGDEAGQERVEAQLDQLRPYQDPTRYPIAVVVYWVCMVFSRNNAAAGPELDRALDRASGWTRATLLMVQAMGAENRGEVDVMRAAVGEALAAFRALGERFGLAGSLETLARVRLLDGDLGGAIDALAEVERVTRELGAWDDAAQARCWMAAYRVRLGQFEAARADLIVAAEAFERIGSAHGAIMVGSGQAEVARLTGDPAQARRLIDPVVDLLGADLRWGPLQLRSVALTSSAQIALAEGRIDAAADTLAEAVALGLRADDMPVLSGVVVALADLAWHRGRADEAAELLGMADALRGAPDPTHPDGLRLAGALGADLGAEAFGAARARGRTRPRAAVIDRLATEAAAPAGAGAGAGSRSGSGSGRAEAELVRPDGGMTAGPAGRRWPG